jgi:CheY-like chemotaxis protein
MDQKVRPVVLVVDDEPLLLRGMAQKLTEAGYEVWQARYADEALRTIAAKRTPISALVTDVKMPGELDGCGLAWRVAATSSRIALIVVSEKGGVRCERICLPTHCFYPNQWTENASSMKSAVVFADADVRNHRYGNFSKSGPARLGKRDQCRKHRAREASGYPFLQMPTKRLMMGMNIIPARMMVATASNIEMHSRDGPIAFETR